jgi:hypothetical protein
MQIDYKEIELKKDDKDKIEDIYNRKERRQLAYLEAKKPQMIKKQAIKDQKDKESLERRLSHEHRQKVTHEKAIKRKENKAKIEKIA